ncbi:hypothetical protein AT15_07800 [Kosmotoga arenicorallina S304]|uniref:BPL/LPL catalytic domain-containing protein n=1 Tax=Kosmotoga arenicorallina S304 TaxID=1453497 RepID=A0A182C7T6_9BACT|nr:lipoate--protein ligase family protein [Kosmotoga arenicorallina]OAA31390.1 hypothetical protein AT15_07800 [Kosmotoga arenicorallina S304]
MKVFIDAPRKGATNMAIDMALSHWVTTSQNESIVLRFYRWDPPCLSLGRNQHIDAINVDYLNEMGFDLVRRPTGGKAVLHWVELTYSFIAKSVDKRIPRNVVDSYMKISTALKAGLNSMGFPVEINEKKASEISDICFQVPSVKELVIFGKKLVGSAQTRKKGALLQHGSILLRAMPDEYLSCFHELSKDERQRKKVKNSMIGLEDYSKKKVNIPELIENLMLAFSIIFEERIEIADYNKLGPEFSEKLDLYERMFDSYEWNFKRQTMDSLNTNR